MINKKTALIVTAILATSLLNATEVEIQIVGGKNKAENLYTDPCSGYDYKDSNVVGIRDNIFLSKNNALQLAYDRLEDASSNGTNFHRYSINYLRTTRDINSKLHPFFLIGAGHEDGEIGQKFFNYGIGATLEISNNINLVLESKAIKKHDHNLDINTNIGLGLMIGNEPTNIEPVIVQSPCITTYATKLVKPTPCSVVKTDDEKEISVR